MPTWIFYVLVPLNPSELFLNPPLHLNFLCPGSSWSFGAVPESSSLPAFSLSWFLLILRSCSWILLFSFFISSLTCNTTTNSLFYIFSISRFLNIFYKKNSPITCRSFLFLKWTEYKWPCMAAIEWTIKY